MQIGFWDESLRLEKLSKLGDSLEKLNRAINWEVFRPKLTKVFTKSILSYNENSNRSNS